MNNNKRLRLLGLFLAGLGLFGCSGKTDNLPQKEKPKPVAKASSLEKLAKAVSAQTPLKKIEYALSEYAPIYTGKVKVEARESLDSVLARYGRKENPDEIAASAVAKHLAISGDVVYASVLDYFNRESGVDLLVRARKKEGDAFGDVYAVRVNKDTQAVQSLREATPEVCEKACFDSYGNIIYTESDSPGRTALTAFDNHGFVIMSPTAGKLEYSVAGTIYIPKKEGDMSFSRIYNGSLLDGKKVIALEIEDFDGKATRGYIHYEPKKEKE